MKSFQKLEVDLIPVLAEAGYDQLDARIYKASWSTVGVEHFIYFSQYEKHGRIFSGDFGIRNPIAEAFSVRSIRTYGGDLFRIWDHVVETSCAMRFSFGRLEPGSWPIAVSSISTSQLPQHLRQFIQDRLHPAVGHITTAECLLALLIEDQPFCPWVACNGAIRAAQIVALAGKLGRDANEIQGALECHKSQIANGLSKGAEMRSDPMSFVTRIQHDWNTHPAE
jgi:hypothetical protein